MKSNKTNLRIVNSEGNIIAELLAYDEDPLYWIPLSAEDDLTSLPSFKNQYIALEDADNQDKIQILGESIVYSILGVSLKILAPKQSKENKRYRGYHKFDGVELRPGTIVIGGRDSGFNDAEGVIVEAHKINGDPNKNEDWLYRIIGQSDFDTFAPQWLLLKHIGFVESGPSTLMMFDIIENNTIDELLLIGEREYLQYFATHPDKIDVLSGSQFEILVKTIYGNLGFQVDSIGRWNQPDGGVDIIAVSKTEAGLDIRLAIQCKASKNKISANPIRELASVLDRYNAHQGIVATTSYFTSNARDEKKGHYWRVTLQDRDEIYRRLLSIVRPDFKNYLT